MAQARTAAGFTLIEVVIALAIVAMTTSFAVSSYRRHLVRSHRIEAAQSLLTAAAEQEKFYLAHGHYGDRLDGVAGDDPPGLPVASTTTRGRYRLYVEAADAVGYRVIAERSRPDEDAGCFRLWIDESGRRRASDAAGRDTTSRCW